YIPATGQALQEFFLTKYLGKHIKQLLQTLLQWWTE
ncbi:hypothetical protein L195_g064647, partial [Trifolium pratense]